MESGCTQLYTANDFLTVLNANKHRLIVAMLSASWCGPCKSIRPTFVKHLPSEYTNVKFVYVDIDKFDDKLRNDNHAFLYNVNSYPTFKFYKNVNGMREIGKIEGADYQQLVNYLNTNR